MPALIWIVITVVMWSVRSGPKVGRLCFNKFCGVLVAPFVTPRGHTPYGQYSDSEAYRSLVNDDYWIDAKFASNAVASIETE